MLRLDGAVDAGALDVCAFVLLLAALVWLPLWVLLCAKALQGNTNRSPPNSTPFSAVGRNFIRTLFPAWRSRPRVGCRTFSLSLCNTPAVKMP
jgi:hypothetical protein